MPVFDSILHKFISTPIIFQKEQHNLHGPDCNVAGVPKPVSFFTVTRKIASFHKCCNSGASRRDEMSAGIKITRQVEFSQDTQAHDGNNRTLGTNVHLYIPAKYPKISFGVLTSQNSDTKETRTIT